MLISQSGKGRYALETKTLLELQKERASAIGTLLPGRWLPGTGALVVASRQSPESLSDTPD